MHDLLLPVSLMCLLILLLIVLLKKLHQPYLIAYILAGFLLGPHVTGIVSDPAGIAGLGEIGILLLMFFLGMEIEIPDRRNLLLQPVIAQTIKILLSLCCVLVIGTLLHWKKGEMFILTILFVFNSTAVVSEFLRKTGELHNAIGKMVLNILLLQDILIAPAFTFFQFAGSADKNLTHLLLPVGAGVVIFLLLRAIRNRNLFQWPVWQHLEQDHDLQVFTGALICLGFALLASMAGLSGPVGSFAAGIYLGRTKAFNWLGQVLKPFKVFFVALFFVSVGLMLDAAYIRQHYVLIITLTMLVLLINSLLSAAVFRMLGYAWQKSLYAGALLSQTGELGLLACSIAFKMGFIDIGFFKASLAITGLTLLLSTAWITILRKLAQRTTHSSLTLTN
jgi:CPA2 family monovalent cation:H+ antiporter-2